MASNSNFNFAEYPIVIGIDFGTTYSGCSYAFVQNEEVVDITKWPKQFGDTYPKVPTLNFYLNNSKQLYEWGYGAKRMMMRPDARDQVLLSKFKLHLDENLRLPPLPNGLTVVDAIADYLRAFHSYVLSELQKGFAANYDTSKFRYCLTVPAMWSDPAKAAMRLAAIRAGIVSPNDHPDRLMLISEPEAAALYCEKKCDQFNLRNGERFMICDAGGGTVDLIVFEIEEKNGMRTLKEVTKGHGASCGSGFLDLNMRRVLERKLQYVGAVPPAAFEQIMDKFIDGVKPNFDGEEDQFMHMPAAMGFGDITIEEAGIEAGIMRLTAEELRNEVYEPVVQQVLGLIEQQLQAAGKLEAIFLVGGFGQSNYLYNRVHQIFATRVSLIGVPPRGALAVVRGAVYFGLNPRMVTQRISRRSYGVETRMLFEPGLDPPEYSITGSDGRLLCRQRFSVFVRKGQPIKVDDCITKEFTVTYPNDTDSDLFACDLDGTPPRLTTHPDVKKVGNFPIRMPDLPGVQPGERVRMTIKMYFGLTELQIRVIIRDKEYVFTSAFDADDFQQGQQQSQPQPMSQTPPVPLAQQGYYQQQQQQQQQIPQTSQQQQATLQTPVISPTQQGYYQQQQSQQPSQMGYYQQQPAYQQYYGYGGQPEQPSTAGGSPYISQNQTPVSMYGQQGGSPYPPPATTAYGGYNKPPTQGPPSTASPASSGGIPPNSASPAPAYGQNYPPQQMYAQYRPVQPGYGGYPYGGYGYGYYPPGPVSGQPPPGQNQPGMAQRPPPPPPK
ncbi:uncharacterized protein VTP21DRAFT_4248 [Calcarisporiella thermophila]|uniref:uncharacterized protein n=1 Tax=Calcarisporiella thermophila TaxID=911321 RepID=UPI0037442CBC